LAGYIDRGLSTVQAAQADVRHQGAEVEAIQATFDPDSGSCAQRQAQFQALQAQFQGSADPIRHHMGEVMASCAPGLFVGGEEADLPWAYSTPKLPLIPGESCH
jgi:hypothetical protein